MNRKHRSSKTILNERAGGRCEICGCFVHLLHRHHRRPRQMGGSKIEGTQSPCNGLMLCPACHLGLVEVQREKAYARGWLVHQGSDPAATPVVLWDGTFYLAPDGARVPVIRTEPPSGTFLAAEQDHSGPRFVS